MASPHMKVYARGFHLDLSAMDATLRSVMRTVAEAIRNDFERCVATWHEQPEFVIWGPARRGDHLTVTVGPRRGEHATKIFQYVDLGTRGVGVLRRPSGKPFPIRPYTPKTVPGRIGSSPGGYAGTYKGAGKGPSVHFRRSTTHVGVKSRGFTEAIAKKYDTDRPGGVRDVVQRGMDAHLRVAAEEMRIRR